MRQQTTAQLRFAQIQSEGLGSRRHRLFSLQDALRKSQSPRGWARFSRSGLWKLAVSGYSKSTPKCPLKVSISQGLGPFSQIEPAKAGHSSAPRLSSSHCRCCRLEGLRTYGLSFRFNVGIQIRHISASSPVFCFIFEPLKAGRIGPQREPALGGAAFIYFRMKT